MRLINNYSKPLVLDDGTILAAAGTPGSQRDVESVSDRDRKRYVDRGRVAMIEPPPAPIVEPSPAPAPSKRVRPTEESLNG